MKVLTKSRFKLGLECPNKLFYTGKPEEYVDNKIDDPFMAALAQGGFQVEALARMQYPDGIFIDAEHYEYKKAAEMTRTALQQENVTLFEAAFLVDGLFVRTDILVKTGNQIQLIEVKAKSYDPYDPYFFFGKRGGMKPGWKPYLFDLAFQKYVVQKSNPDFHIRAFLMMADKSKTASVDGLNQMFRVPNNGNPRTDIITKFKSPEELGTSVLCTVDVDQIIYDILGNKYKYLDLDFEPTVVVLRDAYLNDIFLNWETAYSKCKKCEFKATAEQLAEGKKSGFRHCFKELEHWKDLHFEKPNAFEIWNYRGDKLIKSKRLFLDELTEDDFNIESVAGKMSPSERRWTQVEKSRNYDKTITVLKDELQKEIDSWKFPLHFIDFETSAVALPFHKGRRPYEQVAFQFSHHQYNEDGTIEHKHEFISTTAGEFPNFIFARALMNALNKDEGSIFRYSHHENSVINQIMDQLAGSTEPDKQELITFLKSITASKKEKGVIQRVGNRNMIDLCQVVKDYYYNPYTKGSNSIKQVLPACLNSGPYLKAKYSRPIGRINLTSTNFDDSHVWFEMEGNLVKNPYKLLPTLFEGWDDEQIEENLGEIENIADGGSALMAYSKLQYTDMTDAERQEIKNALLKYCELDTLAMVMIYEHFRFDILKNK
jgi:hypothetical protein